MLLPLTTLTFPDLRLTPRDAPKLRGHFAKVFGKESILFHNHHADGTFRYAYPLVQYKVIRGVARVMGIGDGAEQVLKSFMDLKEINLDGQRITVDSKELHVDRVEATITDDLIDYYFATPCFLLNQENYREFRELPEEQRNSRINQLLKNHFVTALRGIGLEVTIDQPILLKARLESQLVNFKNQRMQMYRGTITTNIRWPEALGIGKSCSRGFGTVVLRNGWN